MTVVPRSPLIKSKYANQIVTYGKLPMTIQSKATNSPLAIFKLANPTSFVWKQRTRVVGVIILPWIDLWHWNLIVVSDSSIHGWSTLTIVLLVAPSSPSIPEVKKVGKNFVELAWTPPTNDGGSKILGYVVEKKPVGSDQWTKATPYTISDNNVTIGDLPENGEMEFRVRAINKAGESEPSSSTGRVKITEYPSKILSNAKKSDEIVDLDGRAPTFVKKVTDASAPLNGEGAFTVEFDGNPAPEVKWFRNGLELSSGGRYRITTQPNESKSTLTFTESWESDNNSKITCELVNPLGRESCEAMFHVKSKSSFRLERIDLPITMDLFITFSFSATENQPWTRRTTSSIGRYLESENPHQWKRSIHLQSEEEWRTTSR